MSASAPTSRDGTRTGYRRIGSGPAVVVMHGALGTSLRWLAVAQIEELAGLGQVAHNADPDRVARAIGSFLG